MRAELTGIYNTTRYPFLSNAAANLHWYYYTHCIVYTIATYAYGIIAISSLNPYLHVHSHAFYQCIFYNMLALLKYYSWYSEKKKTRRST